MAQSTPSGTFWAPSTPVVQAPGILHVTYDTYFGTRALYPVDAGLTLGIPGGRVLQAEVGFDLFYPTVDGTEGVDVPVVLNGKIGSPENGAFPGQPAWSVGIYGVGFRENLNDQNILYAMLGRTFQGFGTAQIGAWYGLNRDLFRDTGGEDARVGLLAGWLSPSIALPPFDHLTLAWDLQTGENAVGATGGGPYVYFTPDVALGTGPVWFFEPDMQPGGARWMWTLQLDVDIDF